MKIRLIYQTPSVLGFGGGHVQALMYKKYISKQGIDIDFLNFWDRNADFDILHILGLMKPGNCLNALIAKGKNKKIILSPIFYTSSNLLLYKVITKIFSRSIMGFSQNRFYLAQKILSKADAILPNSFAEASQINYIFDTPLEKMQVLYNGVEPEFFENANKELFLKKFNVNSNFVLCVANINRRKNILNLIDAFLRLNLKTKLVIIGDYNYESDLEYCNKVRVLIEKNRDKIIHIENMNYRDPVLLSAYLNAKIHILPSTLETPGLVNLEAGLAGCKLVLGGCKPVREYFSNFAHYCNPKDIGDISKKLKKAYEGPNDSFALREFIKNSYTWDKIADDLINVYKKIYCEKTH